jgi:hypothetical protein
LLNTVAVAKQWEQKIIPPRVEWKNVNGKF